MIDVRSERGGYRVKVGEGLLDGLAREVAEATPTGHAAVVTNETVGPLYGRQAAETLGAAPPLELPDGEVHKRWPQVEQVCRWLLELGATRQTVVLAVGGGVVTDTAGFAAAVFMRGVEWVAVPTTLLAMVDAAVGGKTGVNLEEGKNLVGAFWAPRLVLADVSTLATLPGRELRAGLAEVVKTAWIGDQRALDLLARPVGAYADLAPDRWEELVLRSVRVKAAVVGEDEREAGRRRALNLGHTVGHALETVTGYSRFLHGEAVAWGLLAAARLARRQGLLGEDAQHRLEQAVARLGSLPGLEGLTADLVTACLAGDKKADATGVRWVLPTDDGVVLDRRVEVAHVRETLVELGCRG